MVIKESDVKKIFFTLALLLFSSTVFAGGFAAVYNVFDKHDEITEPGIMMGFQDKYLGGDVFFSNGITGISAKYGLQLAPKLRVNVGALAAWNAKKTVTLDVGGVPMATDDQGDGAGVLAEIKYGFLYLRHSIMDMNYRYFAARKTGPGPNDYARASGKETVRYHSTWAGISAPF